MIKHKSITAVIQNSDLYNQSLDIIEFYIAVGLFFASCFQCKIFNLSYPLIYGAIFLIPIEIIILTRFLIFL